MKTWLNLITGTSGLAAAAVFASDEPLDVLQLEGNLADAKKPPEVKAGKYVGEVQGVEKKASNAGNNYYAIQVVIPMDQLPEDQQEAYEDGAILYWNRQLVPRDAKDRRTLHNMKELYTNFGLDNNITSIDPNEWMGCKVGVVVRHEKYQGEDRAQISALFPAEQRVAARPAPAKGRGRK